ncbi:MAG: hypothetical protein ACT6Q3_16710, partial [Sphingopyxis sp.]
MTRLPSYLDFEIALEKLIRDCRRITPPTIIRGVRRCAGLPIFSLALEIRTLRANIGGVRQGLPDRRMP